jgi:excisionase family DNA binding protein
MQEINLLKKSAGYKRLKIFTIEEAAETLKTRTSTIKSLIKEGKLSAKKIGGRWILTENDLRKFLNLEEKE